MRGHGQQVYTDQADRLQQLLDAVTQQNIVASSTTTPTFATRDRNSIIDTVSQELVDELVTNTHSNDIDAVIRGTG